jgi:apolipoprotein N-acyltransferase
MYPELIIWPETAYPHSLIGTDLKLDSINTPKIFKDIIKKTNAHLIIGGYDRKKEAPIYDYYETEFNSVFHFTPQFGLKDIYHKHILIPFGETLPFGPFNRELSQINQNVSFFAKGKDRTIFKLNDNIKFITPICYEILSPRFIRYYLNQDQQTQIIINLTNDSWYGDTAEPHQHLYLAKWRAIEFNKHLIRSTNTGISTIVLPDGNEINRLGVGERKYLDIEIKLPLNPQTTFYQKYELAGLGLLSLIMILIAHLTTYGLRLKALFN